MGILGALFAGVSGLDTYSSSIEVIGNNIANANTAGFKGSRAEFSDILASSLSGGSSGNQIGRGVQLAAVTTQFTQGSFETTSSGTDLAIDGKGFFIVANNDGVFYTRAGKFTINAEGILVNSRGDRVQGVILDVAGNPSGTTGDLNLTVTNAPPQKTSSVNFVANLDASDAVLGSRGTLTSGGAIKDRFQFISGTNDVIAFNDGTDKTASLITDGLLVSGVQYTGAEVATALKLALETRNAGGDTYTVAYNQGVRKFEITNNSANGNPITLRHSDAASTVSDDIGFSTAANDILAVGDQAISDNQVQFNVVLSRNVFTFSIDGASYIGTKLPSDAGALQATVATGGFTADGLSQAIQTAINNADNTAQINRVRAVSVTYNGAAVVDKFQISSQTAGATRVINIPSDSNSFTVLGSSFRVNESLLGVLGLTNLNDTDTFTFTTGFNDKFSFDFDTTAGPGAVNISLIGPTAGLLTNGAVVTAKEVAVAIKAALELADTTANTYTVTFDSTVKKFDIKKDAGPTFSLLWATTAAALGTTSRAADTLGYTDDDATTAALVNLISDTALTTAIANRSSLITDGAGSFEVTDPSKLTSSSFSTSVTLFDSLGSPHSITLFFRKIGENIWEYNGTVRGDDLTGPTDNGENEQVLFGRLWFTESGSLDIEDKFLGPVNADNTLNLADKNGFLFPRANRFNFEGGSAANQQIDFDFGTSITTDASVTGGLDGVTQFAGQSAVNNQTQNGFTTGTLQAIGVGRNGNITGQFTNGQTRDLARIILANFNAPQRLSIQGSSLFSGTQASGQPILGQAARAGFGSVLSNSIELSNVDIAEEFVKLIQDQQAFQANARVISTTEDLLDEVVNLTR